MIAFITRYTVLHEVSDFQREYEICLHFFTKKSFIIDIGVQK